MDITLATTNDAQQAILTLQNCLTHIAHSLPHFKSRPTQRKMMQEVFAAFYRTTHATLNEEGDTIREGEAIVVIEGPTGTGKSLGYLLPAVIAAKALNKHLVISSATVMLQEQLAYKDIPFIAQHAGIPITYAIAKGRGRYACTQRLYQCTSRTTQQDLLAEENELAPWEKDPSAAETEQLRQLSQWLHDKTWTGERDSLPKNVSDAVWSRITNDRHGCVKKSCQYFKECPFYNARAALEKADIVIANHDLVLADLNMGGGVILPMPADTFYCLDEAHHLADKAIKQFAAAHSVFGVLQWLEKLGPTIIKAEAAIKEYRWNMKISTACETIGNTLQDLSIALRSFPQLQNPTAFQPAIYRCPNGILPTGFSAYCAEMLPALKILLATIQNLQESIRRKKTTPENKAAEALFNRVLSDLGFFVSRIENVHAVWNLLATQISQNEPPIAKWIIAENIERSHQIDYTLCASPVRASSVLAQRFWRVAAGALLTSATLRSLGTFNKVLTETGLCYFPKTRCISLDSPFDFARQGVLVIPTMQTDPKDPVAHTQEIITLMPKLLNLPAGEGALALFASKKQMLDVATALPKELQQLLLIQGEQPKDALINAHFQRIKTKQSSILFGLASFAEGLDLPGNACTQLIIAKLPFAVPDDPLSETLAEWIQQRGGNPFAEITLPDTSIKLIQAVGRLIRSETDFGTVTILDSRLVSKPYGRLLLKNLPAFKRVIKSSLSS